MDTFQSSVDSCRSFLKGVAQGFHMGHMRLGFGKRHHYEFDSRCRFIELYLQIHHTRNDAGCVQ
jgi:hypothetical protein